MRMPNSGVLTPMLTFECAWDAAKGASSAAASVPSRMVRFIVSSVVVQPVNGATARFADTNSYQAVTGRAARRSEGKNGERGTVRANWP
jgi:hypothetical protein